MWRMSTRNDWKVNIKPEDVEIQTHNLEGNVSSITEEPASLFFSIESHHIAKYWLYHNMKNIRDPMAQPTHGDKNE